MRSSLFEPLEKRQYLSVLPAPAVTERLAISQGAGNETTPSVAVDINDPTKLMAVWTRHVKVDSADFTRVEAAYSSDSGLHWNSLDLPGNLLDLSNNQGQTYENASNASVGFDRNDIGYIVYAQHNDSYGEGAIVMQRFDFSGNEPTQATPDEDKVVYQWSGGDSADKAALPMLVVDNNVDTFSDTDGQGNATTQTDPFSGNLYIAWATSDLKPQNANANTFNPHVIEIIASADQGDTWSSPMLVSDNNYSGARNTAPRLVVSQGDVAGNITGGQITVIWDRFTGTNTVNTSPDSIMSDNIEEAGTGTSFDIIPGPIGDAGNIGGPAITNVPITVNITDPNFIKITDVDLMLGIDHDSLSDLDIFLIAPNGTQVQLVRARNAQGTGAGLQGGDLGKTPSDLYLGTTFDDDAARIVTDQSAGGNYTGHYRPQVEQLSKLDGLAAANFNGVWTLRIVDNYASGSTTQSLVSGKLVLTSGLKSSTADKLVATSRLNAGNVFLAGNDSNRFELAGSPDRNPTPSASIASDNTLGAYSQNQGFLYVTYLDAVNNLVTDSTVVRMMVSADGGATWSLVGDSASGQVAPETAVTDGYSDVLRPQMLPEVAVDQATGTVVVTYMDARNDAARARFATYVTTSIDGGQTFSKASFLNQAQTAKDAISGKIVNLGPVAENQSAQNPVRDTEFGFGDRLALAVFAGKVYSLWPSNQNGGVDPYNSSDTDLIRTLDIATAVTRIAAGPRIVTSTQGAVGEEGDEVNILRGPDGGPAASTFIVTFDRFVDPASFTISDVVVTFRGPTTPGTDPGTNIPATAVTPLDAGDLGATQFKVDFAPGYSVGTYSYAVGPNISDRIRTVGIRVNPGNTTTYSSTDTPLAIPPVGTGGSGDPLNDETLSTITIANPPAGEVIADVNVKVTLTHSFDSDLQIALISPDGTIVPLTLNNGGAGDNFTNTTFDDDVTNSITGGNAPFTGSFRPEGQLSDFVGKVPDGDWVLLINDVIAGDSGELVSWSMTIVTGPVTTGQTNGNLMDQNNNAVTNELPLDVFTTPGAFDEFPLIVTGPHIVKSSVNGNDETTDNLVLNKTASSIDVVFDRNMDANTFKPDDVIRIFGPAGSISGPFTITANPLGTDPLGSAPRTFRIGFPTQKFSGTYSVQIGSNISSKKGDKVDVNLNAGMDALRGIPSAGKLPILYNASDTPVGLGSTTTAGFTRKSSITVTDDFILQQGTRVQLDIVFPNDPDLQATLVAPDGTRVRLFTNVGNSGNKRNFSNTVFDDNATTPIQSGGPPFSGFYQPQEALGTLAGKNAKGTWSLEIKTNSVNRLGTLDSWSLTLQKPLSASGTGQEASDRSVVSFRIHTFELTNPLARAEWVPLGPSGIDNTALEARTAGTASAIAVDPSDPSGNTVYVGGNGGGIFKTTNFLTRDVDGPTYMPLTDYGSALGMSISSIAVFGRNNDPSQSIIFAATGDGEVGAGFEGRTGVGMLRSMDGGANWVVLDSSSNFNANGTLLPAAQRDRIFTGTTTYKILVDPKLSPTGDVIAYVAVADGDTTNGGGVYRSIDTGRTWQKMRDGQATDIVIDYNSVSAETGNLQILYAGFKGEGIYSSPNRGQVWNLMTGGVGNPLILDVDTSLPVPVDQQTSTPNGAKGRIVLAHPALTGNVAKDLGYQGWLYAAVATATGGLDGLYVTKDFGQNWTRVRLPSTVIDGVTPLSPSNDYESYEDHDVTGNGTTGVAEESLTLAVDPSNPNILYLNGSNVAGGASLGSIRVDLTGLVDPHALYSHSSNRPDAGELFVNAVGGVDVKNAEDPSPAYGFFNPTEYVNFIRDPEAPFVSGATLLVANAREFVNDGTGATWIPFDINGTAFHDAMTLVDPATGHTRLILGSDQGVFTAVDDNGEFFVGTGNPNDPPQGDRNGNLSNVEFYTGAVQPSGAAAQIAQSLLYGGTLTNALSRSDQDILDNGNIVWNSDSTGTAYSVATDQQGDGTVYAYYPPASALPNKTDFFQVNGVSRTFGLLQVTPTDPQWPVNGLSKFAVNPINGDQIVISSQAGRVFATENQGRFWSVIGDPAALDGTNAQALAYGAPDPNAPGGVGNLGNFIYAGTKGGKIFVTFTGGGGNLNAWKDLSAGLDGSSVQSISTNPNRGSHEAYAVTVGGVYYMADSTSANATWVNITGVGSAGLQSPTFTIFNDPAQTEVRAQQLTSVIADWRYAIPNDVNDATKGTYPVLYVAARAGVFRSLDRGLSWSAFPNVAVDGSATEGGYLPHTRISDLDFSLGNVNPTTGHPVVASGNDLLMASTYGRGAYGIRVAPLVLKAGLATGGTLVSGLKGSFVGYTQQTAFGNTVNVKLFDYTNPNSPVLLGQGNTDGTGKYTITGTFTTGGVKTIKAFATDDLGLTGPGTTITVTVNAVVPKLTISDVTSSEGNNGTKNFTFNVTLDSAPQAPVTLDWATAPGTAESDVDYAGAFGSLTFAAGETSKQIVVSVNGDIDVEPNETFTVNLTNLIGAIFTKTAATGTITNDDVFVPPPTISIANNSSSEGNSGTKALAFTVKLSNSYPLPVTVKYSTADGTALVGSNDYSAQTGTLTFAPGETSKVINITVKGDTIIEPDEMFFVNLNTPTNSTIGDSQATGTITNDDSVPSSGSVTVIKDPLDSSKTALQIIGTNNSDTIKVTYNGAQGKVRVQIGSTSKGSFSFSGIILVYGQNGNDNISIETRITRAVYAFGGSGNDTIAGGNGNDVIQGQAGNDSLKGNDGRDIIIGGDGKDSMDGSGGDDVLLPGDFLNNPNFAVLASLQKEWVRTDKTYALRVSHMTSGGGFNLVNLNKSTVFSSTTLQDTVTGGSGTDLFLIAISGDILKDKASNETVINIG